MSRPTTSKKMREFPQMPIGNRKMDDIPGIGAQSAINLSRNNYGSARRVLGEFLKTDGEEQFVDFLRDSGRMRKSDAETAYKALDEYEKHHL
ncbi:hypothetical protein JTB14_020175 [Gonioctena quinquepunctata]|nr:hypothetical protein JTB14_020175 [Gonioctena quinquepunctata]